MVELELLRILRTIAESKDIVDEDYLLNIFDVRPEQLYDVAQVLRSRGFLRGDCSITASGMRALSPFRVDNAIILSAGIGKRFAPFSWLKPKGLITVKGEVLIERQIRQLRAAGIQEIIIVVGYKKEQFLYLEDQFGVKIVVNPEYDIKNTHSSLFYARDYLKNSYICNADNYYPESLFHRYEFRSIYTLEYKTNIFALGVERKDGLITDGNGMIVDASHPACDQWVTGFAYFDRLFSEKFIGFLMENYDAPGCDNLYWEQIYAAHVSELELYKQEYSGGRIKEFDTPLELAQFDTEFIQENHFEEMCYFTDMILNEKKMSRLVLAPFSEVWLM